MTPGWRNDCARRMLASGWWRLGSITQCAGRVNLVAGTRTRTRLPKFPRSNPSARGNSNALGSIAIRGCSNQPGLVRSDAQRQTIYALSTPPGKGGVAVLRVSGLDAIKVWRTMVCMKSPELDEGDRSRPRPWRMYRCDIVHPRSRELLDSGLAVYFKGAYLIILTCFSRARHLTSL